MNAIEYKRMIVGCWAKEIEDVLKKAKYDESAALAIMYVLRETFEIRFNVGCLEWITRLVSKWRAKRPDVHQQAESIAAAIFSRRHDDQD